MVYVLKYDLIVVYYFETNYFCKNNTKQMNTITTTNFNFPNQKSVYRGKVREVYNINNDLLVMVATDRLSAFDVVMPKGIPDAYDITVAKTPNGKAKFLHFKHESRQLQYWIAAEPGSVV